MLSDKRLFDGSDPLYAPCISWSGKYPSWKCPAKYVKMGYATKSIRIQPQGSKDDEHHLERALQCRERTRHLKQWFDELDMPKVDVGTWHWLITRYRSDAFSPFHEVKANTREGYKSQLKRVDEAFGHMKISDLTFQVIKSTEKAMRDKGRSNYSISILFSTISRVAKYGSMLGNKEAREVKAIINDMRFKSSPPRTIYPTREQVEAIVAKATEAGSLHFACGILLQFELALRAVDVRGQWLRSDNEGAGLYRNGTRWADGATWDMIGPDFISITKVVSKTASSRPEAVHWDLTPLPEIRQRLEELSHIRNVGPIFIATRKDNLPYTASGWRHAWNRYRDEAGVPKEIQVRDLRAGAITEAKQLGASPYALRDAAGHSTTEMTDVYARNQNTAEVIELRQNRGKQ